MYKSIIKPILFRKDPEEAHYFTFRNLKRIASLPMGKSLLKGLYEVKSKNLERKVFGLTFPNPVGLAAGLDKDAILVDELACLGFGFIEIGTLTPKPQPGNDKPRLFRLLEDQGIINRMGFNNQGVDEAVKRLKERKSNIIVGGNIGKNKVTPNENALEDYKYCFNALFDVVDYFVVNVSSPNTPGLRELQDKEPLKRILNSLQELNNAKPNPKPILLKIAPDLEEAQLDEIVEIVIETKIAGLIATNTTISRDNLKTSQERINEIGAGGLSGVPVHKKSVKVVRYLAQKSEGKFPIIGVGGIHKPADAIEMLNAGASLVQVYTGFIYEGPALVKEINEKLAAV